MKPETILVGSGNVWVLLRIIHTSQSLQVCLTSAPPAVGNYPVVRNQHIVFFCLATSSPWKAHPPYRHSTANGAGLFARQTHRELPHMICEESLAGPAWQYGNCLPVLGLEGNWLKKRQKEMYRWREFIREDWKVASLGLPFGREQGMASEL